METEVLGEILPQRHFVHHKYHMTRPGFEPGPPPWEASDYLLLLLLLFGLWGYWHCGYSWPILSASGESEDDCGEVDGM
jgi:hypothetical protein